MYIKNSIGPRTVPRGTPETERGQDGGRIATLRKQLSGSATAIFLGLAENVGSSYVWIL